MKQVDLNRIKAVAFDFGGTLDIPGIHWFDFLWGQSEGVLKHHAITKDQYWDAYVYGERRMEKDGIPRDTSFYDTIATKLSFQFDYMTTEGLLEDNNKNRQEFIPSIAANGMRVIDGNLKAAAGIIGQLNKTYDISIVSNFYGNLKKILSDAGIFPHLNRLLDSTIAGVRKPDPELWKMALTQCGCEAGAFLIVGDSMKNDILPAQFIGCPTLLISKHNPPDYYQGDWVDSLEMLAAFFNIH